MSDSPIQPFDSGSNIAHIHGGPRGGPPGGDQVEARVAKLESDMTDIKVLLGKIEVRLDSIDRNMATKVDLSESERRINEKIAAVDTRVGRTEGELKRTLGVWQFLAIMIAVVGVIVKWPLISAALGL